MKVLVVYTHPNPQSFNHALLDSLVLGLKSGGHLYRIVDLYDIGFDPVLRLQDMIKFREGKLLTDVEKQQQHVSWADVLIFVYPIWWGGMPAMLKGYLDRVFSVGFAYKMSASQPEGLLGDKHVILIRTTALSKKAYQTSGVESLIRNLLKFKFTVVCGVQSLTHHVYYAVPQETTQIRERYLQDVHEIGKLTTFTE